MADKFTAKLAQVKLATKFDIKKDRFDDKLKIWNTKFTSNKIKHVLVENELNEVSKNLKEYQ